MQGQFAEIDRQGHSNLVLSFDDCTVTDRAGRRLFEPGWGRYDMAVGARIISVCDGMADRESS